jgi:putative ABC transport system permease protein
MNATYIKQIFRHLARKKLYSGISILGLGIGLGCVILMATYIIHEFSYDKYYNNASDIYRVIDGKNCKTFYAMGEAFKRTVPEIKEVCRMYKISDIKVKQNQQFVDENNLILADPSIIKVLDINIINGSLKNQLTDPNTIIISQKLAKKYFKENYAVGQTLELAIGQRIHSFRISGIYKDLPSFTSFQTNIIGCIDNAFSLLYDITYVLGFKKEKAEINYHEVWDKNEFVTFLQLYPKSNKKSVEAKCSDICLQHRKVNNNGGIRLQPVTDMYLHSEGLENNDVFLTNHFESLKIFLGIGLLVLLVAIVNFILISNADNNNSITEIACRKVNGASKKHIIIHYLFKSVLIAFISLIPALIFVQVMLPVFNNLFEKDLQLSLFFHWKYVVSLIAITLLAGLGAGLYLGLYVSGINPVNLFKKDLLSVRKRGQLNNALIIVQFFVFILLSSCFLLMQKQYNFSLKKDLGLNTKNILAIDLNNDAMMQKTDYIKNKVMANPNVIDCVPTSFTSPPSDNRLNFSYRNSETGQSGEIEALVFGKGLIEMMDIPVIDGRSFDATDKGFAEKFIINEAAAKKYKVRAGEMLDGFKIIGVVKNFHYHSLHEPVKPIFIAVQAENFHYMLIKTNGKNPEVAEFTRQICNEIVPGFYMDYELLDDRIAKFYKTEESQMGTIGFFAAIALGLSVIGLVGFVTLNLVKRTKEIGIRKINGANNQELIRMINTSYVLWILIAFIIACPVAWYVMNKWLQNFAYKTELSWWVFAAAGAVSVAVAIITVSWQSWRAATKNPVEALRYE